MPPLTSAQLFPIRAIEKDHAMFDGAFVRHFDEQSNWTESKLKGDVPVTLEQYIEHTRLRFIETVKTIPEFKTVDFSRRPIMQHLGFLYTYLSGLHVHTLQEPFEITAERVHTNMKVAAEMKMIPIDHPQNPLSSHPMAKGIQAMVTDIGTGQDTLQWTPFMPMKPDELALAKFLSQPGKNIKEGQRHVADILRQVSPFLAETDNTNIEIRLSDLRAKLSTLLEGKTFLDEPLRAKLMEMIMEDWLATYTGENEKLFTEIETEVKAETGTADIFNHEGVDILEACFEKPLTAKTIAPDMRQKLIKRRPVMESVLATALETKDLVLLKRIGRAYERYFIALNLPFGKLGHLSLAVTSHNETCDIEQYRSVLR